MAVETVLQWNDEATLRRGSVIRSNWYEWICGLATTMVRRKAAWPGRPQLLAFFGVIAFRIGSYILAQLFAKNGQF
jgi:hypothetical protein